MPKTCSEARHRLHLHGPTMGTRWAVSVDVGPHLDTAHLRQALADAVDEVDHQMSPWKPASDLNRLNAQPVGHWLALPAPILLVLARALEVARLSAGTFNPAVGALIDAWGFGAARRAPDPAAIRAAAGEPAALAHVALELDAPGARARRLAPVRFDLCAIAKGYAVDRMIEVLAAHGVQHALASLDGELRALGPQANGEPWPIAIEAPVAGQRRTHGVIELEDLAIATSGNYRHFLDIGGQRLSHLIDPRAGAPVRHALASVTVLARTCMDADAWATALLVAGPAEGFELARRLRLDALFLLRHDKGWTEIGLGRFAPGSERDAPA
ncbi:MAG TPA: FAD:protein FMN transferase [Chiayiivirga sp.]|nr:FAD:protein FMN transferase [Chiayiivirga sp.]